MTSHENVVGPPLSDSFIRWILVAEGAVSVAAQFLVLRQLLPFVGSSVVVTSIVISIFLLALAFGYQNGGKLCTDYQGRLSRNFFLASLIFGLGSSYFVVETFFHFSTLFGLNDLVSSALFSFIFMAPFIYLLGQTIPILINYLSQHRASERAGLALNLSTVGNVLGGLLTTLVLMHFFGVAVALSINAWILMALWYGLSQYRFKIPLGLFVFLIIGGTNIVYERLQFDATTAYANYKSHQNEDSRIWLINGRSDARLTSEDLSHDYVERAKAIVFDELGFRNKEILLLGAGGFSFSVERPYENRYTYVDIDSQLRTLAETYFLEGAINGEFVAQDARAFVRNKTLELKRNHGKVYDAVFLDAFSHRYSVPQHLLTYEFFIELREVVREGGVILMNIVANPFLNDPYSKRMDNTLHRALENCVMWYESYEDSLQNILYTCRVDARTSDKEIYRDSFNQAPIDSQLKH